LFPSSQHTPSYIVLFYNITQQLLCFARKKKKNNRKTASLTALPESTLHITPQREFNQHATNRTTTPHNGLLFSNMASRPNDIGIKAIELYFPSQVSTIAFERARICDARRL
jgi:hypothetical protein